MKYDAVNNSLKAAEKIKEAEDDETWQRNKFIVEGSKGTVGRKHSLSKGEISVERK